MTATNKSRKLVLAATVVGLALMLGASMIYRMANPSLTVTPRGGMQTMPQGATPQGFPENMPPEMAKALQESGKMPGGMSGAGAMSGASSAPTGGMPGANNMETVMQRMQSDPQAMAAMQQLMQQLKETPNDPKTLLGVAEQFMRMGAWERGRDLSQPRPGGRSVQRGSDVHAGRGPVRKQGLPHGSRPFCRRAGA